MSYEYLTQYDSPNYTAGRPYGIKCIAIHWWGDPASKPTFEGVINTLCSASRQASAHYVAEDGRVACLVDCGNRAWANGDGVGVGSLGNDMSISIECNPRQSDGDYNTIGELIRDIRGTYGDLLLYPHNHFSATQCPGTYDLARLDRIARNGATGSNKPVSQAVDIDALARAVIRGEYGTNPERRQRLGANYEAVQKRVNELLGVASTSGSNVGVDIDALARAVIRGEYGNGEERKMRLGANYEAVQARVNDLLR